MALQRILLVGRPNVGKSTFINRLLQKKRAITLDYPGVTRDVVEYDAEWQGKRVCLVDCAGVLFAEPEIEPGLHAEMEEIVKNQIASVDRVIFLTEYLLTGLHPYDRSIADVLRPYSDKVILAINKVDHKSRTSELSEYYQLGLGEFFPISCLQGTGVTALMTRVLDGIKSAKKPTPAQYKIALLGCPNSGKSSFLNAVLKEKRAIVHEKAGTTRDAIHVTTTVNGCVLTLTDTAGIRKRAKRDGDIEYYSIVRSLAAIKESDLVVIVLDATRFLADQDKKIIRAVLDANKNMVIFVNKMDMIEDDETIRKDLVRIAQLSFPALSYYPFVFGSAQNGQLGRVMAVCLDGLSRQSGRISTADLNRFVQFVIHRNPPSGKRGKQAKIYYMTQAESSPPTFVLFVNHLWLIGADYTRFLERKIREFYGCFNGIPIRFVFKSHREDK